MPQTAIEFDGNLLQTTASGWVAERFKAPVLKTGVAETSP